MKIIDWFPFWRKSRENFYYKIFSLLQDAVKKLSTAKEMQQCRGANQQKLNANWISVSLNYLLILI